MGPQTGICNYGVTFSPKVAPWDHDEAATTVFTTDVYDDEPVTGRCLINDFRQSTVSCYFYFWKVVHLSVYLDPTSNNLLFFIMFFK